LFDRHQYAAVFVSLSLVPILGTAAWYWISVPPRSSRA
jgi:hypothetical protein